MAASSTIKSALKPCPNCSAPVAAERLSCKACGFEVFRYEANGGSLPPKPVSGSLSARAWQTAAFGLFCLLPGAVLIYLAYWVFGSAARTLAILAVLIFACVAIIAIIASGLAKRRLRANQERLSTAGIMASVQHECADGSLVALDYESRMIAVASRHGLIMRSFDQLVAVEVERDGTSIQRTNRGSQLAGVVAGGVLLGPIGALIGGTTGSKRLEERTRKIALNIYTSDQRQPVVRVPLLLCPIGGGATPGRVAAALTAAQEWDGLIKGVMAMSAASRRVI